MEFIIYFLLIEKAVVQLKILHPAIVFANKQTIFTFQIGLSVEPFRFLSY